MGFWERGRGKVHRRSNAVAAGCAACITQLAHAYIRNVKSLHSSVHPFAPCLRQIITSSNQLWFHMGGQVTSFAWCNIVTSPPWDVICMIQGMSAICSMSPLPGLPLEVREANSYSRRAHSLHSIVTYGHDLLQAHCEPVFVSLTSSNQ